MIGTSISQEMPSLQVVVSLWIHAGQQTAFESYERKAARIMQRHGGSMRQIVRTTKSANSPANEPFEVHFLEFPSLDALQSYRSDPELTALSGERETAILRTEVILGTTGPRY